MERLTLPQSFLEGLFLKKRLLEAGDERHKEITTALVMRGGAMRCVAGSAKMVAIKALGLLDAFDHIVACSGGSPPPAFAMGGLQAIKRATAYFYYDLPLRRFISLRRLRQIADIDGLIELFERGPQVLDAGAVQRHRSRLSVAVTRFEDASFELLDGKCDHLVQVLRASMALPGLYQKPVHIGGVRYVDGGVSFDILEAVKKTKARYVLVIANGFDEKPKRPVLEKGLSLALPSQIRRAVLERHEREYGGLQALARDPAVVLDTLYIPETERRLGMLTMDVGVLKRAAEVSFRHALRYFGKPDFPDTIDF